ncbi:MAG: ABC transporter substrate-binding protein, partial [Clostridiaceae bacterium]|nr:ABC transporter substrate-binding protein [Clostridiaceae bacterium]
GLIASMEKPGGLVTGTSDMAPIADQIALLLGIKPDMKTVGLIYNLGEQNSVEQIDMAKVELAKAGVKVVEMTVTSTNDVEQMMTNLAKQVDGIYIPTDNTLAAAAQTVGEVAKEYKVPVVAGSVSQVEEGGLATYGIDYYQLGLQTGRQALKLKVLGGNAEPKDVPAEYPKDLSLEVNEEMAAALGIDPKSIKSGK